jgi:hypothetical protein
MKRLIPFSAVCLLLLLTMSLACFALRLPVTKEELILESRDIIHGIITDITSKWDQNHSLIYSFIKLHVIEVFKGEPRDEMVIQMIGGSVGDTTFWIEGNPELKEGMDVIIHTTLYEDGNPGIYSGDRGVYTVNNGVIEELNMTLGQFRDLVDRLIKK